MGLTAGAMIAALFGMVRLVFLFSLSAIQEAELATSFHAERTFLPWAVSSSLLAVKVVLLTSSHFLSSSIPSQLTSHLETTPYAFPGITLFSFCCALFVTTFGIRRLNSLRKVNLGWREELRQVGDKWGRGERVKRVSRRRD